MWASPSVCPLAVSENVHNYWNTWYILITFCIHMHVNILMGVVNTFMSTCMCNSRQFELLQILIKTSRFECMYCCLYDRVNVMLICSCICYIWVLVLCWFICMLASTGNTFRRNSCVLVDIVVSRRGVGGKPMFCKPGVAGSITGFSKFVGWDFKPLSRLLRCFKTRTIAGWA